MKFNHIVYTLIQYTCDLVEILVCSQYAYGTPDSLRLTLIMRKR